MELLKWCRFQWDRVIGAAAFLAAGILLVVGYGRISRTEFVADQVAYLISAGFTAVLLVGVGATLWLSADLRDEWRKLHRVEEAVRQCTVDGDLNDVPGLKARLTALEGAVADLASPAGQPAATLGNHVGASDARR